ncbi:uncharacterized protein LOC119574460 [Penaeus monodon]|uniref:uncharacterized protein LOC119574460 n=1 Tax=Penaeus monodon TaxID=6687 RepID=UPI0018A7D94D|nr:uncharacterized protein LOC119574460 [Penaeus monodon]XP_037777619.1 uncharacterized protein LOC119574460 [Penaeus monodon]
MLKSLRRLQSCKVVYLINCIQNNKVIPRPVSFVQHLDLHRCYGIRHSHVPFVEEDTLSFKILEYMRISDKYTTALTKEKNEQNSSETSQAIKQMLLVIAHNPDVKTSDVLHLFSLYASSGRFLSQDIISNKSLMSEAKHKILQSFPWMTENELKNLAYMLKELEFEKSGYLQYLVKGIDEECLKRSLASDLPESLRLFDILLILHGNRIYRKREYDTFLSLFEANVDTAHPHHLVQILHYIGLGKKRKLSKEFVLLIIEKLDKHLADLTFGDLGIAVAGIFKSNVKLERTSAFVKKVADLMKYKIKESVLLTDIETYGLVSMIKLIRVARFHDDDLLSAVKSFVMSCDERILNAQIVSHILAMFSNCNVYNEELFDKLENQVLKLIRADTHELRMRDLTRVLWCFSHVGHKCSTQTLEVFDESFMEFIHKGEVARSPYFLSDALFSMAILQHYPEALIKEAFKPEMIQGLKGHQKSKQLSRLLILHECLKTEVPTLRMEPPAVEKFEIPSRTLADEIQYRPHIKKLSEGAKWINSVVGRTVLRLQFPIPYINYASLTTDFNQLKSEDSDSGTYEDTQQIHIFQQLSKIRDIQDNKNIVVEVLDLPSLLNGTSDPVGLFRLKFRLLEQLGWDIRYITSLEVESCGDDVQGLGALLLEKINLHHKT